MEELCLYLEVFDEVIDQLSDEKHPTIHKVLPLRNLILDHCEIKPNDSDGLQEVKVFLGRYIQRALASKFFVLFEKCYFADTRN